MKFSHEQFEINHQKRTKNSMDDLNPNNINRNNTNQNLPSSKIKLNCFLTDSFNEINLEVDKKITLGTLKKKIIEEGHLNNNKKFSLLYNDKDFTNFNKLRLLDIIDKNAERMSQTEPSGFNTIKLKIVPTELDESILSTDSKFKQMLECNLHPHENAHFYCLKCNISFCALCIEKHISHDFLDKYDFSKSKQEIVKSILRNMLALIKEKKKKDSYNIISEKILNTNKNDFIMDIFKEKNVIENIKLIWANYEQYSNEYKNIVNNLIDKKVSDFNHNLLKFKMICINNLTEAQKSTDESDVITLNNDYFQGFHQTLKDLNIGRDALMNYLEVRNNECDYIIREGIKFDEEILNDLKNILNKIQQKNIYLKDLYINNEENKNIENEEEKEKENGNVDNNNNNINENINIDEIKKNNGLFENNNNINNNNNLNNIDKTNNQNYLNNMNNDINDNNYFANDNNGYNNPICNSLEVSVLSNAEEGNIKNQYINATFGTNVNEREIFINDSPKKTNIENTKNNNFILDEPSTLINKNHSMINITDSTKKEKNNDNDNDKNNNNKTYRSSSSCGFNDNIDEYGEGGNSLIKKMNNINKKEFQTLRARSKENKTIEIKLPDISNSINKSLTKIVFPSSNKFIMKRKLLKEIYLYNIKEKKFESVKDFKRDTNIFKRFYQFSIYLNAKNNLYITGGKTKDEQISNSFYCYNYEQNSLTILPNMLNARCSHSMIYINNSIINDELFIIGGHNNNTGERFSFKTQKWKLLPCLHTKERQVPTLINVNDYLYTIFGFVNGKKNPYILGEKINLNKLDKWEQINAFCNNIKESKLNKFNVGIIKLSNDSYLLLGGEISTGGETEDVFKLDFKNNGKQIIISETNIKMPCPASFIDKNFIEMEPMKYAQFDMKKSNFIFYDCKSNKFGMRPMLKKK